MSRKVSEIQKQDILNSFKGGNNVKEISNQFKFSIPTIIRQLKNLLGQDEYKRIKNIKLEKKNPEIEINNQSNLNNKKEDNKDNVFNLSDQFVEIAPLDEVLDLNKQKEISSEPISTIEFPKLVYMIISNKVELQPRKLKDYPEWQFLPSEDLERNTIEIFNDLKSAKKTCTKDQKVIKVPNTNVFKIVAPILITRGISRIISNDRLIAL